MSLIQLLETGRSLAERIPYSVVALVARLTVADVFWRSGQTKVEGFHIREATFFLFRDEYKVPLLDPVWAARLTTFNELTFSVLLAVGLATRLATLPLLAMIAVIQTFVYPQAWTEHLLWSSILLFLLTRGPGKFSLDYLVERWIRKDRPLPI